MTKLKQKALAKKILNNPSIDEVTSEDMVEVGYSPNTRPHEVVESSAWQELMQKYLPDEKLATVHSEGLEATKPSNAAILLTTDGKTVKAEEQGLIETPDFATRAKYLELGYKIKGKLKTESNPAPQLNFHYHAKTQKEKYGI